MLLSAERVRAAGVLKLLGRQMWARRVHQAVDGKHRKKKKARLRRVRFYQNSHLDGGGG